MPATDFFGENAAPPELEHKGKKVTEKISENIQIIANEPSLAFYRIQEHVRKSLPQLVEKKHEVQNKQQAVQGACFDTEYAINAVQGMQASKVHFQNIQDLLKNAMFMRQQIQYEQTRRQHRQEQRSMYRSMTRTNTVDIPVSAAGNTSDFTQSLQVERPREEETRARSSSLSNPRRRSANDTKTQETQHS